MKKIIIAIAFVLLLLNIPVVSYAQEPSISAKAAILIDAHTGQILYEKNSHQSMYPASTTKILTGILAIEEGNLTDQVVVNYESAEGAHIALKKGEILSLNDLVHALLIESANDAAIVVANHLSGSVEKFADRMNKKAIEIGAKNTHFTNPNGLPDENHITTAYDLAMIAKYAMENETFRSIVSNTHYSIPPTNKTEVERSWLSSENRLLKGGYNIQVGNALVNVKYPGATGIKTGYTDAAGNCLVSSAKRGNQELISVVLNGRGKNVYVDTHKLLNYGFDNFTYQQIAFEKMYVQNIDVNHGDLESIPGIINQNVYITLPKGRENEIVEVIDLPKSIAAPLTQNQVLGKVEYKLDHEVIAYANVVSTMEVNQTGIQKVIGTTGKLTFLKTWWFWAIVILVLWRGFIIYKRRKKRKIRRSKLSFNSSSKRYL